MNAKARVPWGHGWMAACLLAAASVISAQELGGDLRLSPNLVPRPELAPEQVVRIQLDALRHNDSQNRGIEVAFRFASPQNRLSTGPLARFVRMIQQGPYRLMLAYESAAYHPVEIVEDRARQRVTLIGSGLAIDYDFYLSRQAGGEWVGCWMTDAVIARRPTGLQVQS